MKADRAAGTQASSGEDRMAFLLEESTKMAEAGSDSDLTEGTAPVSEETAPDETASEIPAAESTPTPERKEAPSGAVSESQAALDATIAQVQEMQKRLIETQKQKQQLEKDRREVQSFGDRRRNDMEGELAAERARREELERQLQSVTTRQRPSAEDDDYFSDEKPAEADILNHPVVAEMRKQLDELRTAHEEAQQAQTVSQTRAQQQAEQKRIYENAANHARDAAYDIYGRNSVDDLTDSEREVIHNILLADLNNNPALSRRLERQAARLAAEERTAALLTRAGRSRVISEAGTSSSSDDRHLTEDSPGDVFKDIDFDFSGLSDPQVSEKRLGALLTAAERMAKQPA